MRLIDKLEKKLSFLNIEDLMLHISVLNGIVYVLEYVFGYPMTSMLAMNPDLVLRGQVWRLITFVFIPPATSPLFLIITLYLYYLIGSSLENQWGTIKFNIFYLFSMIGTIIASFISGGLMTAYYIHLSLFLAFAVLFPDFELMLFFILPIKIKYLAYADVLVLMLSFFGGSLAVKAAIIAALSAFFLFFGEDFIDLIKQKKIICQIYYFH